MTLIFASDAVADVDSALQPLTTFKASSTNGQPYSNDWSWHGACYRSDILPYLLTPGT